MKIRKIISCLASLGNRHIEKNKCDPELLIQMINSKKNNENLEYKINDILKEVQNSSTQISFLVEEEMERKEKEKTLSESRLSVFCEALIFFIVLIGIFFGTLVSTSYLTIHFSKSSFFPKLTLFSVFGNILLGVYGLMKCLHNFLFKWTIKRIKWLQNKRDKHQANRLDKKGKKMDKTQHSNKLIFILKILFFSHFFSQVLLFFWVIFIGYRIPNNLILYLSGLLSYMIILILIEISNRTLEGDFTLNFNTLTLLIAIISLVISRESTVNWFINFILKK